MQRCSRKSDHHGRQPPPWELCAAVESLHARHTDGSRPQPPIYSGACLHHTITTRSKGERNRDRGEPRSKKWRPEREGRGEGEPAGKDGRWMNVRRLDSWRRSRSRCPAPRVNTGWKKIGIGSWNGATEVGDGSLEVGNES